MKIKIGVENKSHIKGKRSRKITNNPIEIDDRILFKLNLYKQIKFLTQRHLESENVDKLHSCVTYFNPIFQCIKTIKMNNKKKKSGDEKNNKPLEYIQI